MVFDHKVKSVTRPQISTFRKLTVLTRKFHAWTRAVRSVVIGHKYGGEFGSSFAPGARSKS